MYTVDYFIKKFEAIPENLWCINKRISKEGQRCAHGHCIKGLSDSARSSEELGLIKIASQAGFGGFAYINNGEDERYQQPTPKQRILAALYDIKANEAVKQAEEIINTPNQLILI